MDTGNGQVGAKSGAQGVDIDDSATGVGFGDSRYLVNCNRLARHDPVEQFDQTLVILGFCYRARGVAFPIRMFGICSVRQQQFTAGFDGTIIGGPPCTSSPYLGMKQALIVIRAACCSIRTQIKVHLQTLWIELPNTEVERRSTIIMPQIDIAAGFHKLLGNRAFAHPA